MKIALVVPHIFMHQELLPDVIFSPGYLALNLAEKLAEKGHQITLFSPGSVDQYLSQNKSGAAVNHCADLSLFEAELKQRGYGYIELLKKHPLTFITLARQVQSELISRAYHAANQGEFELVHIWCNEEELALTTAQLCRRPVVFNHHEPFNFLSRYRAIFPKYQHLNWISFSYAQRKTLGEEANWVGNVYHGLNQNKFKFSDQPQDYLLYMGRIIKPKGVHYAIAAAKELRVKLKIAGKHYAGHSKDKYWQQFVKPELTSGEIEYLGFVKEDQTKQDLLGGAQALLMPSTWQEPFGMVMIEALACGTPVIGFDRGSIPEIVASGKTGWTASYLPEKKNIKNGREVSKSPSELRKDRNFAKNLTALVEAVKKRDQLSRQDCRDEFERRFSLARMAADYELIYQQLNS